jgi:hypothetical protein
MLACRIYSNWLEEVFAMQKLNGTLNSRFYHFCWLGLVLTTEKQRTLAHFGRFHFGDLSTPTCLPDGD